MPGRLLLYDTLGMNFRLLKLRKDPNSPPVTKRIDYRQFCGVSANGHETAEVAEQDPFERVDGSSVKAKFDGGSAPYVHDVRRPAESEIVQFEFADRLQPHTEVAAIANELPRDRDILIHCKMGGRSETAARRWPKPKPAGSDNPDLLLPACKSGDGEQCHTLALKYVRGGGVPKNPEKGFQLMQQGCSHGYAQACFVTSQMWQRGIGTNRSASKASEYLKKACDLGHQGAMDAGECE